MDNTSMQAYGEGRLRNMLIRDRQDNPQKINRILKSEILYVLKNYFDLKDYDLDIDVSLGNNGYYHLSIQADCHNIKSVSYIS